jgi:hypothetical protein
VRCAQAGSPQAGRSPFRCTVRSAGIAYTFLAVLDQRTRALTWCKRDLPPTTESPLYTEISGRCRA